MPSLPITNDTVSMESPKSKSSKKKKLLQNDVVSEVEAVSAKKKESSKKRKKSSDDDEETKSDISSEEGSRKVKKEKKKKKAKVEDEEIVEEEEVVVKKDDPNAVSNFRISEPLRMKLKENKIEALFPIQAMTFNTILDGSDLVGRARTGQGKTLAFVLPILESLTNGPAKSVRKTGYGRVPSVIVLLPTRELANQVYADFELYGSSLGLSACAVYGGAPYGAQETKLRRGVDIVIGTPGRIKDHIERGNIDLSHLKFRVLDEADEMLRMGFVDDVELILGKVQDVTKVQTLLFSATLPSWVKQISTKFLKADKKTADLVGNEKMKASTNVRHIILPCSSTARAQLIPDIIRCYSSGGRTIIFAEKKESASELAGLLPGARALHGDIQQSQREITLKGFRSGKFMTLVATNVAARGLDINDVQLIIQCEPPRDVEAYIHRSGRTGRAGNTGVAVMLYDPRRSNIAKIEREAGIKFEHVSAPQPDEIAKAMGGDAAEMITDVSVHILNSFLKKLQHLCSTSLQRIACQSKSIFFLAACFCRFILLRANPLWVQIVYFTSLSTLGFGFLKVLKPLGETPKNLDLFFTSVSATTVSSMSTVEMQIFSNPQLIIITILMFIGGEVFTSMVGLFFIRSRLKTELDKIASSHARLASINTFNIEQIHLEVEMVTNEVNNKSHESLHNKSHESLHNKSHQSLHNMSHESLSTTNENLRYLSMKYLGYVVFAYFLIIHIIGVIGVSIYLAIIPSAKQILKNKGLKMFTFSLFTIVSTFASCGFVPTNENMVVFRKNSGLLLMLIPQVLLGNTLYPPCLRFCIWVLGKFYKKKECRYLLKHSEEVGYKHLLKGKHTICLVATVFGLIMVQVTLFCAMDWDSEGLKGLNFYQKMIGVLFQIVNSRHTGETVVDISNLSQAILVLFVLMMYLPPYTSFLPLKSDGKNSERSKRMKNIRGKVTENLIFSQLSYLVIFIILVCITERKKLKEDPLNFNVLNIVVEVVSAYGNVGFTMGYSCERQLHPEINCENKWIGFVGKWSDEGKIILILIMLFGRLKKFNMDGGKPWKLL